MRNFLVTVVVIAAVAAGGYFFWQQTKDGSMASLPLAKLAEKIEAEALEPSSSDAADQATMDQLAAAVSGLVTVSYGSFGGGAASDVRIELADVEDAGISIGELSLYGVDIETIETSLRSGAWDELRVADRIDAREIEFYGLDDLTMGIVMTMLGETGAEAMEDLGADGPPVGIMGEEEATLADLESSMAVLDGIGAEPEVPNLPFAFNQYSVKADRAVIDGLTLYPFADASVEGPMAIVAKVTDFYRTSGYEMAALWNLTTDVEVDAQGVLVTANSTTAFSGTMGWNRGDLDVTVARGLTSTNTQTLTFTGDNPMSETDKSSTDYFGVRNVRLASFLDYLANGELPPTTETDIVSLGTWAFEGMENSSNGYVINTTESMTADLSEFHWLIPTRMGLSAEGETYYVENIVDYVMTSDMMAVGNLPAEQRAMVNQAIALLAKQDLTEPTLNYTVGLSWDPDSGATGFDVDGTLQDGMTKIVDLDLILPSFEQMKAADRLDNGYANPEALAPIFMQTSAYAGLELSLEDLGLLNKVFAIIIDVAKMVPPEQNPQAANIAKQSPQELRMLVGGLMRAGAMSMTQEFPAAVGYLSAAAGFIESGGILTITSAPEEPLTAADIQAVVGNPEMTPTTLVETFGVSVTHEAPDGDEADETANEL